MRAIFKQLLVNYFPFVRAKILSRKATSIRNIMSESNQYDSCFDRPRLVIKKVLAKPQSEGNRAVVRRSIGRYILEFEIFIFVPFFLNFTTFCHLVILLFLNKKMNFFILESKTEKIPLNNLSMCT